MKKARYKQLTKITGAFLKECQKEERAIRALLAEHMPDVFTNRKIEWEWCHSIRKAGYCQVHSRNPRARIRITNAVELGDIMATVRHELIHAFLPFEESHGDLFHAAMAVLESNGLHVSYGATGSINAKYFKWLLYTDKGAKFYRARKNRTISFVLAHQGIEVNGVKYYVKKLR